MSKTTLDADTIMARATPIAHNRMPIALSENTCAESVDVIRRNELQVWFLAEHVVDAPLVRA